MENLDLLGFLEVPYLYGQLKNMSIYGKITGEIERPSSLTDKVKVDTKTYAFVSVDVFAIDLTNYYPLINKYFANQNIKNNDGKYMVNGSICCYIDRSSLDTDFHKVSCPIIRNGATKYKNFIIGFGFNNTQIGFDILPSTVSKLDRNEFEFGTEKYNKLYESMQVGRVLRTSVTEALPKFYSTIPNFKEITTKTEMPANNNTYIADDSTYVVRKSKIESRDTVKEYSDNIKNLTDKLKTQQDCKREFFHTIVDTYKENSATDEYFEYMIDGLIRYLKHKSTPDMSTGTKILKKYLTKFENSDKLYLGMPIADYLTTSFDEYKDFILGITDEVMLSGDAYNVCKYAFRDKQMFYANVLAVVLNIKDELLTDIVKVCKDYDLSFINIVNENPYILQYLGNLKFDIVENIAYAYGVNNKQEIQQYRNIAMLNSYMMTENENTIFRLRDLLKVNVGMSFTKKKYEDMQSTGSYLKAGTLHNIRAYLHNTDFTSSYNISNFYYEKYKQKYLERISEADIHKAIRDMIETGMGIVLTDDYITTTKLAEKECYVYDKMHRLGSKIFEYSSSEIDECINQYEKNFLGFTLEPEQRQAVHLLTRGAGVIAGSAGSGKTTVSNCLVYVLSTLEPNIDIKFAAPTGKAAKRMQEVVKQPVKTLHSMFKIGLKEEKEINEDANGREDAEGDNTAYFFDENAMVTLDVFYSVLKKIDDTNSRIFMFGDFNQLPPIGKGLVFKNLLKFMPCVALTVSKRAAEGSNITYNSNLITDFSENTNFKPLKSGDDFYVLATSNPMINSYVAEICKYYLGQISSAYNTCKALKIQSLPELKVDADDIQVVSPLGKPNYNWGASVLNRDLQPIFNKNKGYNNVILNKNTFKTSNDFIDKFIVGDRVIHTDKNMYSMQWYESCENGVFVKKYGFGICNGEVGKLVGYCKAEDAEFMNEREIMPADFEYPDNMRDDATYREPDGYFIIVEYHDYITDSKYYILYRCKRNTSENESNEGINLYGEDFDKLSLFYAGTTHKLQGSQAKIIIAVMGNVSFKHFLTRNMLYTTVTRGQQLVFLIGSPEQIAEARSEVADKERLTIGDYF